MSSKLKVVITGGTGLLGSSAPLTMSDSWDIELWTRGYEANFPGVVSRKVDLEDAEKVKDQIKASAPDLVIHAAGLTSIEDCEANSISLIFQIHSRQEIYQRPVQS